MELKDEERVLYLFINELNLGMDMDNYIDMKNLNNILYLISKAYKLSLGYEFQLETCGMYSKNLMESVKRLNQYIKDNPNEKIYDGQLKNENEILDSLNEIKEDLGSGIHDLLFVQVLASMYAIELNSRTKYDFNSDKHVVIDRLPSILMYNKIDEVINRCVKFMKWKMNLNGCLV